MSLQYKRLIKSSLMLLLLALATMAYAIEQTGTLKGVVRDENSMTLQGVTITINSPNLIGGEKSSMTDADGVYNFYQLPPGNYKAKFSLPGYVTTIFSDIRVSIGRTTFQAAVLKSGELLEEITITAETPFIDPKSTTTTDNFTETLIQNIQIGAGARAYQSVFHQAPGVSGGSNPSIRGSTLGENAYLVDGVDTTDPVTSTFGLNFNFDAIEEVQLQTGGFKAEYGRATGGIGNLVTKTGGNEITGTFDIRYGDESLSQKGKYFDPDKEPTSFFNPAVTIGGPFIKDRLWFFLSYQFDKAETTPFESPVTREYEGHNYIAKLTWMINSDNKLVFQATGDPAEISSGNASSLITSDAASFQKQGAEFFTLKYYSALSANWWLEAQVGYYKSVLDAYPLDEDFMTQANYLEDDGILTENYWDAQYSDRFRNQANVLMTYFKRGWAGSHQFKFGVDVQDVKLKFNKFSPGGGYYYSWISANHLGWWPNPSDPNYYPYFHYVDVPAGELENKGTLLAGFVQDEWTISPKLTANIGFRFDSAKYDNDIGREVMDLSLIQPRFGLAFDARGNGTSLWKCSYSTYMDPSLLALPMFLNAHANATDVYLVDEGWGIDWNGDGTLNEAYYTTFGGPGGTIVDPEGLSPTSATEYQVGYEQRLTPNQGIKVTWVYRETDDIIEDVYWGRDGIDNDMDGTIDGIDTDFDGTIDIDDDEEQVYVIKNLENGRRRYYGVELRYNAKIPRGEIIASYTWGKAKGNIGYTQSVGSAFDYPALSVNRYGYMYYDRRHTVKINGYINLPLDFQVGWDAICHTGEPYDTLASAVDYGAPYGSYFVEQRGSRRLPNFYQLNVEGRKTFKIGKTMVQLILSIYNLLDDEIVTSVNELYTSTNFGKPLTYQQPRRFEVGLKYQF